METGRILHLSLGQVILTGHKDLPRLTPFHSTDSPTFYAAIQDLTRNP